MNIHENKDISQYTRLQALLRRCSEGCEPKKSQILELEHINRFITDADNNTYLSLKVALITGYSGACRRDELVKMTIDDLQFKDGSVLVTIPKTKIGVPRLFIVTEPFWVLLIKQYEGTRPKNTTHTRLFLTYRNGYCVNSPNGINKMGEIPKITANILKLPNPHTYTGHCFRRSSISHLANKGSDLITIKRHGGWKSSTVGEGYIQTSLKTKIEVAHTLCEASTASVSEMLPSTSSTSYLDNSTIEGTSFAQQITFESFTLGRFVSFTNDGCPDGALQITESNRPQVGGSWCGTSWGPVMYYSETKSITIHVNLYKLSKIENGYNFDFHMDYKLLKKRSAIVRYGGSPPLSFFNITLPTLPPEPEYYLGELIAGTYCSRIFSDCDKKHCRLQSPNFPGIYPRNLTCYYAVRQHEIPTGKHALITVKQPKGQLISIRSQSSLYGTAKPRELKVWNACDEVQDYVTVYDGYTTRDAVILKFCGGGEPVPEAVSSGHELLVEFSTSPYGTFLQPAPVHSLHGFQLEVEVKFVDQQTPTFVKQKRNCEFWLRGTNRGILESPIHSLPANTTCLYHLQGMDPFASTSPAPFRPLNPRYPDWRAVGMISPPPRYRVWLSIVKFHAVNSWDPQDSEKMCRSYLNVWDGQLWQPSNCEGLFCGSKEKYNVPNYGPNAVTKTITIPSTKGGKNVTLLARFCREHVPRSCEHSLLANGTTFPRPCSFTESYLTSGDTLTLELKLADSTALNPVSFRALYEFVDLHLDGDPYGEGPCSRKFGSMNHETQQKFRSPGDIFLYGRGGSRNLSCVYRFEAQKGERIKITLTDVRIKNRNCDTKVSKDTDRLECVGNISATLRFFEVPWSDVPGISRDCLCGVDKNRLLPYTYISSSNVVELRFDVTGMNSSEDFNSLFFEGSWKFIRTPACDVGLRKTGANGELVFSYPSDGRETNCESSPRALIPGNGRYLYVKIGGVILKQSSRWSNNNTLRSTFTTGHTCETTNRIIVHTVLYTALICPEQTISRDRMVEVFSEGWNIKGNSKHTVGQLSLDRIEIDRLGKELPRTIVVEFYGKEAGSYPVMWLELSKRRDIPPNGLGIFMIKPDHCQYRCPELDACINSSVWCDGRDDCPSGVDEAITHCSFLLQLPPLYLFFGSLFVIICSIAFVFLLWRTCRRRPRSILQTRLQSLSSDTAIIEEKGVICS